MPGVACEMVAAIDSCQKKDPGEPPATRQFVHNIRNIGEMLL